MKINSACLKVQIEYWKVQISIETVQILDVPKIQKENLKVDMLCQSSWVKTELIFLFEFSIQILNIPFEYSRNQFEHSGI